MAFETTPTPQVLGSLARIASDLGSVLDVLSTTSPPSAELVAAVESVGRLVDAARIRVTAPLVADPTAVEKLGFVSPVAAIATTAQVSERTARARVAVASAVSPSRSLSGAPLPPALPVLGSALDAGRVGADAAALITRELLGVASRVPAQTLAAAEAVLVNLASGRDATGEHEVLPVSVDYLAGEVRQVAATIDPDGARPREERAVRRRGFRIGAQDADGLIPVSGQLLPEIGGLLKGMLEAHRRSPKFVDSDEADATAEPVNDPRTPDQRRHDMFAEILTAANAAESAPRLDGQPVTVIVTVASEYLHNENGLDGDPIGVMTGSTLPISRQAVELLIDANGYRTATLNPNGAVLGISSPQRCFTPLQRLALAARDGHRCFAPGCTNPHIALQAHHVIADRHGGPTSTDNGILLCYWHHRIVDTGPWQYRMNHGIPEVRGPGIPQWSRPRASLPRAA